MDTILIPVLSIVAVINVILALVIFSRGLKTFADLLFSLIAFTCALWSIAIIGFHSDQYSSALDWVVVTHSSALLIPFFFLSFSLSFPTVLKCRNIIITGALVLSLILEYLILFTDLIIGVTRGLTYDLGTAYALYALTLMLFFSAGFVFLFIRLRSERDPIRRKQVMYVLVGSLLASMLAIIPDLIYPYINIFEYTWLGPIFTLLMVISLFMAMLKYHLFNVKVILTEITSVVIVVGLLIEVVSVKTSTELFLKLIVLVIVTVFSYLLVRSVYREIEQRERIEKLAEDLEKANKRLTELDRQKSEFVSFASHQLRAPLTAMKGYGSLLLEGDLGELPRQARDGVERIFESTKTLVNIVDDYLNVSRIELGTMKYNFETIDLKTLVEDVVAELKPNIEKIGLKFEFSAENNGTDYRMTADRDKLKQVIANLIDNSVKYTPSGTVSVSLSYNRPKHVLVFQVKDTGIGIDPEVLPHLFQKFSRAGNAGRVNIKGTGLGLFVAKQMVEAHHGSIRAESAGEGKGSAFIVELEPFRVV